jgi:low affinity Fe/Cu permease
MQGNAHKKRKRFFEKFALKVSQASRTTSAFVFACLLVLLWAISGPFFHYSQTWQLLINTASTIVTFLMVFLIQKSQNKDSLAIQLKLNELLAAHDFASNQLVDVENMSEDELKVIQKYYSRLRKVTKKEESLNQQSHSFDEGKQRNEMKKPSAKESK